MPAKRPAGARNETVRCEYCGEDYSVTYRHCPFCDEVPASRRSEDDEYEDAPRRRPSEDDEDDYPPPRRSRRPREDDEDDYDDDDDYDDRPRSRRSRQGGKHLLTNERGGGYRRHGPSPLQILGGVLSVLLIAAAAYIVFVIVKPFLGAETPPPSTPVVTGSVPVVTPSRQPTPTTPGLVPPTAPGTTETPPAVSTAIPAGQTATGFSLGKTEFTLSATYPTYQFIVKFTPAGSTGSITWSSSKPSIVSVDQKGKTTAVSQGVATITATMAGGYTQSCMVRSSFGGAASAPPSAPPSTQPAPPSAAPATPSAAPTLSLNVTGGDFTLKGPGDTWTLKVKGASGAVTWSVKDSSIATVSASGTVTGVASGRTVVTATVDGKTLECIVRVG